MPGRKGRFEWVNRIALTGLVGMLVLLAMAAAAVTAAAVVLARNPSSTGSIETWLWLVLAFGGVWVSVLWAFVAYGLVRTMVSSERASGEAAERMRRVETLVAGNTEVSRELVALARLSDRAKSLVYRDQEIEAVSEAVHSDLIKQDYATAEALVADLEEKLGYGDEAKRLRQELEASRKGTMDEKIDAAIKRLQAIINAHDWPRAVREAKRLIHQFPDNEKAASVRERIDLAHTQYKRNLLQAYGEAVRRKDIDRGVELLRELDQYLAPQEAAALEESARGVFKAKLLNLGVQFSIAVTEREWAKAVVVGEQIVNDYPNSRMAHEVADKIDLLRSRAGESDAAQ